MYDYDTEYRRLGAAGLQGWAGSQWERNLARLTEMLERLERDHFTKPPARMLELGCGNGLSSAHWMARRGYEVHGIDQPDSSWLNANGRRSAGRQTR